jgi:rhodanese-related sulfurtransferase
MCFAAAADGESEGGAEIKHVGAAQAEKVIKEENLVIVDIRTPAEFKAGHLPGARNIDFKAADFKEKVSRLDRERTYLVHCQSGRRSTNALETFKALGFKSIIHLDGGFASWEKSGKTVERD